jgi:hypothetical protein
MTPISASSLARPASATKPGVFGPTRHASYEVTDQRRDAEAVGECAEDESQPQTGDNGGDKGRVMRHCLWSAFQNCDVGYAPPAAAAFAICRLG